MKKVLKIVLVALLISLSIASIILYAIFPNESKEFVTNFWDVLNRPLPIVGFTSAAVLIFIWRVFVSVHYGKKRLEQYKGENQRFKEELNNEKQANKLELERQKEEVIQERKTNKEEIAYLRKQLVEICNAFPNLKVKQIGKNIEKESNNYGERKEGIDNNPEAKKIQSH